MSKEHKEYCKNVVCRELLGGSLPTLQMDTHAPRFTSFF